MPAHAKGDRGKVFLNTFLFVLGFSIVFALLGVLLQTVFAHASEVAQEWISRIAGTLIIFFGLFMLDLIPLPALWQTRRFTPSKGRFSYLTSFVFGAAFAVGWTPCVSAALGAIIALAASQPASSFWLLISYSLGIGLPFLIVGFFLEKATVVLRKWSRIAYAGRYAFALLIILLGILVFTQRLSDIANLPFAVNWLASLGIGSSVSSGIGSFNFINFIIAFLAGLFSFASPCVLPLLPTFIAYLASITSNEKQ